MEHSGGCHCGNIQLRLRLSRDPAETPLRACGCSFCRRHNARAAADPAGLLELQARDWSLVEPYRFGSGTADFILCRRCGVYVAALCETPAGLRAVVNVNCLADGASFSRKAEVFDFDGETVEARLSRRAASWMPAIVGR
jgi:hypothetical protein